MLSGTAATSSGAGIRNMLLLHSLFNLGVIRLGAWKVKGIDGGRLDLPERLRINRKYRNPVSPSSERRLGVSGQSVRDENMR